MAQHARPRVRRVPSTTGPPAWGSSITTDSWAGAGQTTRARREHTILRPRGQAYHLTTDLVNDATRWVQAHHALPPERPFFLYFATGAMHAPIT